MKNNGLINELADSIALDGLWDFRLGIEGGWGKIKVPGCWEKQGYPKRADGPAYYRREIFIPASWAGKTILAQFDAVSYACGVSLNGMPAGGHTGLWTPFNIDLSQLARPGETNILELCVYKPGSKYPVGSTLAGFLPDIATTFGGVWQPVRLTALDYAIRDLRITPDIQQSGIRVQAAAHHSCALPPESKWTIQIALDGETIIKKRIEWTANPTLDIYIELPGAKSWEPARPVLYSLKVTLDAHGTTLARATRRVGFRQLSSKGDQLLLNGQPFMARGVLSWGWDPQQIAPYYSNEQIRSEIQRIQSMGFNLIKLCLFVPNSEYFEIADEMGMLLWQEWPMWSPEITSKFSSSASTEYAELFELTRAHPAVVLYSLGCELDRSVNEDLLGRLNHIAREAVSDVLICDNSGSGESYGGLDYDFSDFSDYHPYFELHFLEPLLESWRRDWKAPRPLLFGEFCDADTFRQLDKIIAASGGQSPWWMTVDNPVSSWRPETQALIQTNQRLAETGLDVSAEDLVQISYAQSLAVRKFTLETIRRRAGMGGYVITGLRDTPIACSGIWDDLEQAKWPSEDFRLINGENILCLETSRRRSWVNGGDRPERLDPYNLWSEEFQDWPVILGTGSRPYPAGGVLSWQLLLADGSVLDFGLSETADSTRPGQPQEIGRISCRLPHMDKPMELRLEASFTGNNFQVSNNWPVWVYPKLPEPPRDLMIYDPQQQLQEWISGDMKWASRPHLQNRHLWPDGGLVLTTSWDPELMKWVEHGGRALLLWSGGGPLPVRRCPFWREAIKVFSHHPLWERFPQRGFTDLQFFGLASDVAFNTSQLEQAFPANTKITPILRRLDARQFHVSDYLFEARSGNGILVGCTLNLQGGKGAQPFGLRHNTAGSWLLWSLLSYLAES